MPKRKSKSGSHRATAGFERRIKKPISAHYVLRLYVTGITAKSTVAISNIRALCEEYLPGRYDLEVIDIYQHPARAAASQIIAAPTLIKEFPKPVRRMIGALTDPGRVLLGLDIKNIDSTKTNPSARIKWTKP